MLCGQGSQGRLLPAASAHLQRIPVLALHAPGNVHGWSSRGRGSSRTSSRQRMVVAAAAARGSKALKLRPVDVSINWFRWEMAMLEQSEQREEERAREASEQAIPDDDYDLGEEAEAPSTSAGSAGRQAFFRQYDDPGAHVPLLRDAVLTRTWQQALQQLGPDHIRGKVVLDVGCGPGQLAMMCAQAGAEHVIAVDGSQAMVELAQQAVEANGLSDRITVLHVDVESPAFDLRRRVDVLVSNWAGAGLLGGGMARAVARARRDLLKPGGLVLPSRAEVFVSGIEDREALAAAKAAWDVPAAGLTFSPAMVQVVRQPRLDTLVRSSQVATSSASVLRLRVGALGVGAAARGFPRLPFTLRASRDERLFGLALHFDLGFGAGPSSSSSSSSNSSSNSSSSSSSSSSSEPGASASSSGREEEVAVLTTDPRAPPTHFQQLVLSFPRAVRVVKGDAIEGALCLSPTGPHGCDLHIKVELAYQDAVATTEYVLVHSLPREAAAGAAAAAL